MSQEQLRDAAQKALDALEEIAMAGMSGTGQESEDGMRDWHARQAWKFIGIAARALDPIRQALATQPDHFPESGKMMKPDLSGFDAFDVLKQGRQARATQPEQAKGSEVDELVSLLAACRDIAARLAPGVADDLLMQAVGGPSEVPAYIEGVISELTHPAPAAQNEREARVIEQNARKAAQEQLYAERERHTAEVKRLQAEIGRLKAPAASVSVSDELTWEQIAKAADTAGYDVQNDCTKRDISTRDLFTGFARAIRALRPAQAGDQWREAVEEQFAVNHTDMPEDPREAIKKLIATEVRDALDPTISSAAAALVQAGVPDDIVKDAQRYRWLKAYDQNSEDMGICKWVDEGWNGQWVLEHDPDTSIDAAMLAAEPNKEGGAA